MEKRKTGRKCQCGGDIVIGARFALTQQYEPEIGPPNQDSHFERAELFCEKCGAEADGGYEVRRLVFWLEVERACLETGRYPG